MELNFKDISFYGSSIRPELWQKMDDELSQTNLSIEIIWAGPKGLDKLPSHTKWIKTDVKPVQCWEIAARACQGEVICQLADDLNITPYNYDKAYKIYKEANNPKTIVQPRFYNGRKKDITRTLLFPMMDRTVPKSDWVQAAGGGSIYNREFFNSLEGFDNGFIAIHAEQDLSLRAAARGANILICKSKGFKDSIRLTYSGHSDLVGPYHKIDYPYLFSLYIRKHRVVKRLKPHQPFIFNNTILTKSQGPKGKWK